MKADKVGYIDDLLRRDIQDGVVVRVEEAKVKFVANLSTVPRRGDPGNDREILDFTLLNRYIRKLQCNLVTIQ